MRLSQAEVVAIKTAALDVFGGSAVVRLFGSRVHDHLRGGDIDLHVEVDGDVVSVDGPSRFVTRLHRDIGERAIDVLIERRGNPAGKFELEARRTGVIL